MHSSPFQTVLEVRDYDLSATLSCGQAFRWRWQNGGWEGVIGSRWVRLVATNAGITAQSASDQSDWSWLADYLQTSLDYEAVLLSFPDDEPMRDSVTACRGLRLLRQDPWECLASFILSSTKQIVQIQQIISLLCERFGTPVPVPPGQPSAHAFPTASRLAAAGEAELRACKMGFRAPNLLAAARQIAAGEIALPGLHALTVDEARDILMQLPGVGAKMANCVLLFSYGFQQAFPVDVWVAKALRQLYFPTRRPSPERLRQFIAAHFGANAGYAQQYLFHYMRTKGRTKTD
jgi:N-glycosylase/DNA lyase